MSTCTWRVLLLDSLCCVLPGVAFLAKGSQVHFCLLEPPDDKNTHPVFLFAIH
jgi:hypothetical protein